jgi:hypothetical protein
LFTLGGPDEDTCAIAAMTWAYIDRDEGLGSLGSALAKRESVRVRQLLAFLASNPTIPTFNPTD